MLANARADLGNVWDSVYFWARAVACWFEGHDWTEWEPLDVMLLHPFGRARWAEFRVCQFCGCGETREDTDADT